MKIDKTPNNEFCLKFIVWGSLVKIKFTFNIFYFACSLSFASFCFNNAYSCVNVTSWWCCLDNFRVKSKIKIKQNNKPNKNKIDGGYSTFSSFPIQFIILSVELKIAMDIQTKIHRIEYFVSRAPLRMELIIIKNSKIMKINEKVIIGIYDQPFTIFCINIARLTLIM